MSKKKRPSLGHLPRDDHWGYWDPELSYHFLQALLIPNYLWSTTKGIPSELRVKKNEAGKSTFVDTCPGQKLTSLIKICKNTDLLIEYWPNKKPECKRRTAWIMHGLNLCERRYFVKWYLHFVIITNIISKLSIIHCYDCILWSIIRVLNINIF